MHLGGKLGRSPSTNCHAVAGNAVNLWLHPLPLSALCDVALAGARRLNATSWHVNKGSHWPPLRGIAAFFSCMRLQTWKQRKVCMTQGHLNAVMSSTKRSYAWIKKNILSTFDITGDHYCDSLLLRFIWQIPCCGCINSVIQYWKTNNPPKELLAMLSPLQRPWL